MVARERKFCQVCHQLGDGYHFGAIACKACAAFFRRTTTMKLYEKFECRKNKECVVKMSSRDSCKACRYAKCLKVGMNPEVVQVKPMDIESLPSSSSTPSVASCSSPILSIDINEYQDITPTLFNVMESYQKLYRRRYNMHCPKADPRATTYREFSQIYINDVYLQHEFLEDCFPEFRAMDKMEKKCVFKYFFVSFLILEMGYRSNNESSSKHMFVLANGDFIDTMHLDKYYYDPDKAEKCRPNEAVRMYQPSFEQMKRNVFQPLAHLNLSVFEFLALVALCTWNEGLDGNPDSFYEKCPIMRRNVITELITFYQKDSPDTDPVLKLSNLLMLLPALERSVELFMETCEMKKMFRCFPFHDKLYDLIQRP